MVSGSSDRIDPLKLLAFSSKPAGLVSRSRTVPECALISYRPLLAMVPAYSTLPLTIGGDSSARSGSTVRGRRDAVNSHSMRATYGDGSATLVVRTFSGDIIIAKR